MDENSFLNVKYKKYIDNHYHVSPWGENGIMFAAIYIAQKRKLLGFKEHKVAFDAIYAVDHIKVSDDEFRALPEEPNSHDNHTSLVCISNLFKTWRLKIHTRFFWKYWWRRAHPRDVIFYLWAKGGFWKYAMYPLLWIPCLSMIISCFQTYKKRGGQKIIKTDGKLLAWLRTTCFDMKLTKKICTWILSLNPIFKDWHNVAYIYFKDYNHPCVELMKHEKN